MTRRTIAFITFFSVFLSLYTLLNAYVFYRGWEVVPLNFRTAYSVFFLFVAYAFLAGRFLERIMLNGISTAFVVVGAYWLAAMTYFYVLLLVIDAVRLADHLFHFLPALWTVHSVGRTIGLAAVGVVTAIVLWGSLNAHKIRVKRLELFIDKPVSGRTSLTLAVASDIHLGTIISKRRLKKIVAQLNALQADIVLLPGDVVDEDLAPVIRHNLGELLRTIRAKYGVIATTGNHEYIGGVDPAVAYLREHAITVLRDEVREVAGVMIVGREDASVNRFTDRQRKSLSELLASVDRTKPMIVLDHQPFRLNETEEAGIDLQLSGHTHNGQLWPFGCIARRIFEVSWGYKRKGKTHVYVSSGVGTWGPPVKIGSDSEIVHITLTFPQKRQEDRDEPLAQASG